MAFNQAISGLKAAENELNVIGNNVSNSATTAFKKSRVEFQDVFAISNVGGSANNIGRGVDVARIAQQFEQGNVSFTDNALDLAISGQGFVFNEFSTIFHCISCHWPRGGYLGVYFRNFPQ